MDCPPGAQSTARLKLREDGVPIALPAISPVLLIAIASLPAYPGRLPKLITSPLSCHSTACFSPAPELPTISPPSLMSSARLGLLGNPGNGCMVPFKDHHTACSPALPLE